MTAIRTKPAPRRRSTARAAPSAIRTSATERGERAVRPSPATSFSTPSRSRNTAARPRCGAHASGCKRRGAQALTWSGRRRQSGQPRRTTPPGAPAAKGGSSGASALSIAPLASVVVFRTAISFARRRSNTRVGDLRMVLSAPSAPPSAPHAAPGGIDRGRPWFSFCCTTCASVDAQRRDGRSTTRLPPSPRPSTRYWASTFLTSKSNSILVESNSTDGTREIVQRYADDPRVVLVLQDAAAGQGQRGARRAFATSRARSSSSRTPTSSTRSTTTPG